jgi:hypothetical protein
VVLADDMFVRWSEDVVDVMFEFIKCRTLISECGNRI